MPADCYIQGELLGISVYSVGLYLHTLKQLIDLLINNHDPIAPDSPLVTVTTVIIHSPGALDLPTNSGSKGLMVTSVLRRTESLLIARAQAIPLLSIILKHSTQNAGTI